MFDGERLNQITLSSFYEYSKNKEPNLLALVIHRNHIPFIHYLIGYKMQIESYEVYFLSLYAESNCIYAEDLEKIISKHKEEFEHFNKFDQNIKIFMIKQLAYKLHMEIYPIESEEAKLTRRDNLNDILNLIYNQFFNNKTRHEQLETLQTIDLKKEFEEKSKSFEEQFFS